jgi:outer membrane protein TolC
MLTVCLFDMTACDEEGKFDYLHPLDAQRTLFNAQAQLLAAQTSVRLAWAGLEHVVSQSIESLPTTFSNKRTEE